MITSTANARVKEAAALARRKARDERGAYLLEGIRSVRDALTDGVVVELFATPEAAPSLAAAAAAAGVEVTLVADHVLERLADSVTPQGVVAVGRQRTAALGDVVGRGCLVVLVDAGDPGNAGTIVRTADAAGATGVVFTRGSVDPHNPKAVRAAAGSITHLPLVVGPPVETVLDACGAAGQRTVALEAGAPHEVFEPGLLRPPLALVLGGEAHGLSPEVTQRVDLRVAVPIRGRAESLNLAAAAAVALYAVAFPPG